MARRLPLIVILGATASGKTKLSLDIAQHFNGEIIGADSMQIYKKLDLISAKPTMSERVLATHHMIDKLNPYDTCTVLDFRNEAISIIDKLFASNKVPIIVGGTNYYIESILWKILIDEPGEASKIQPWEFRVKNPDITSKELHEQLRVLDPVMANRLHPNNKRKIIRALEVIENKGKRISDILREQHVSEGGNMQGGGLRYKDTVIFWLQWDKDTLDKRIDKRVDIMIEEGLVDELLDFHNEYNAVRLSNGASEVDYTTGIYQMIGIKEFHKYLLMSPDERKSKQGQLEFSTSVEDLKRVTRRYARKQTRWVKNRFLGRSDREVPPLYALKVTDVDQWEKCVSQPAIEIIQNYIAGTEYQSLYKPESKIVIESLPNSQDETFFCETCERTFIGNFQWSLHLRSRKHKNKLQYISKKSQPINSE